MKNFNLFILIFTAAVIGGVGLFYFEAKLPDNDLANRDVNTQLLKIDNLNSNINELVLRSRANLDLNYDMLVRTTGSLEKTVDELSNSYFADENVSGSLLQARFLNFKEAVVVKVDHVEQFKSHNSVLRNSEKYTPIVGTQLAETAKQNNLQEISELYSKIVIDVLEFTKQSSNKSVNFIGAYAPMIADTESQMPEDSLIKIIEFTNHVAKAADAKFNTDRYLSQILGTNSNNEIEGIFSAWSSWQTEQDQSGKILRYYTLGYILAILSLILMLAYRLRNLYLNLDNEVDLKTKEIKTIYEDLQESERQLVQNEKMAALGQLVAGVAHEINTPLGYVSSNIETVRSKLSNMIPIFESVALISEEVANPDRKKSTLNNLVSKQVQAYRNLKPHNNPENIIMLFNDMEEGVGVIKQTVGSLTSFSHVQEVSQHDVDINERLKSDLKICLDLIGERKVVTKLDSSLIEIRGVASQLSQVFTNVIKNAAQATDSESGVISVETKLIGNNVEIYISDNGVGIGSESLKRVLDPFFTTKEIGEGTGLGLSISHQVIKAHKGQFHINSTVGAGTKVTIVLPILGRVSSDERLTLEGV